MIKKIEIIRGPGSVLYGSSAYVGVINVVTKTGEETEKEVSTGVGSFGARYSTLTGGGKMGDVKIYASSKYFQNTGWKADATDELRVSTTAQFGQIQWGTAVRLDYKDLSVDFFGARSQMDNIGTLPRYPQHTSDVKNRTFFNLGYNPTLTDMFKLQTNFEYNFSHFELGLHPVYGPTRHTASDYLVEAALLGELSDDVNVIGGVVAERLTNPRGVFPVPTKYVLNNYNAYFQGDWKPVSKLKLIAGLQWNKPDGIDADVLPRASAIYNFNDNWGSKLNYGEAFRSAGAGVEAIIDFPGTLRGNPDLLPEKIKTTDVQVFCNYAKTQAAITGFVSSYSDLITRVTPAGSTTPTHINSGTQSAKGVELEGKYTPIKALYLIGSYTYQTNRKAGLDNITYVPVNMFKLGAVYQYEKGIDLGLYDSYYGKPSDLNKTRPAVIYVNPEPKAFNWLSANLVFKLNKLFNISQDIQLALYGENLLDEAVYLPEFNRGNINSLPGRSGRAYYSTLKWNF